MAAFRFRLAIYYYLIRVLGKSSFAISHTRDHRSMQMTANFDGFGRVRNGKNIIPISDARDKSKHASDCKFESEGRVDLRQ
jgi:hypothetical protein